jgi:hypothetical protein
MERHHRRLLGTLSRFLPHSIDTVVAKLRAGRTRLDRLISKELWSSKEPQQTHASIGIYTCKEERQRQEDSEHVHFARSSCMQ